MTFDPASADAHAEELASLRRQVQSLEDRIAHLTAEHDKKDKILREKGQFFHAILNNLNDMIFILDEKGIISFATSSATKLLGYPDAFFAGCNSFSLVHPDDLPKVISDFRDVALSRQNGIPTEFRLRKADGAWIHIEALGHNLLAHPSISGIVIAARDISQRIDIQEKWYESLAVNRSLIDAMHNAALLMDTEGRILAANKFVAKALGKEVQELVGDNFYNCLPPDWLSVWTEHLQRVKETGRSSRFERIINDRNFYNDIHPIFDKDGKLLQIAVFQYEITRYKKAEERIIAEQRFLRQVIDAVPALIGVRDRDGRYELVNIAVADAYGTTVENIIGKTDAELHIPADEYESFLNDDREVMQSRSGKFISEEKITHADGSIHWLSTYKVPLIDSKGGCSRILAVAMDRTHLKEAEEERNKLQDQLLQSQKMEAIGAMSSGMAHDFNNILMGIQGFISLILYEMSADHPHRNKLENVELYIKRGADLTRQLLGFAQGGKYDVKATNFNAFLEKSVEMFSRTCKEIWIHRHFEEQLWNVEIDQGQMDQVFLNLFINASQAMTEGGNLYLETSNIVFQENDVKPVGIQGGKYIKISVTDEGAGMEKEVLDRIFEPFFTTKPKGVGTGLGLASAYGIIKNHRGIIHAYSEKGKGTTFNIYLPSSDKLPQSEKKQEHHLAAGTETILIVDDEQMNIIVIKEMLEMLGYNIYAAGSGQEALAIYSERGEEIDLVIMDMIMPGIGGGKTFDHLKGINPNIKVILASGYSANGEARSIMDRGCLDFIQKPFQLHELTGRIRKILDTPKE